MAKEVGRDKQMEGKPKDIKKKKKKRFLRKNAKASGVEKIQFLIEER